MPWAATSKAMENLILILVLLLIVGSAGYYIYRAKKRGQVCVGCPHAGTCASRGACGGKK